MNYKQFCLKLKTFNCKINQYLFDIENKMFKKLKLTGIGFKVYPFKNFLSNTLLFKVGFSHSIFLKINKNICNFYLKFNNVFITSDFIFEVTKITNQIKSFKLVDFFVPKGILFYNEKVILKNYNKK